MISILATILYLALIILFDVITGDIANKTIWNYVAQMAIFFLVTLLFRYAEKHGWDTWSGLFNKFKKK